MGLAERMKALDDRVLGKPKAKQPTVADTRRTTLIGLVMLLGIVVLVVVTENGSLLPGVGGLLPLTIANAVQWRRLSKAERDRE